MRFKKEKKGQILLMTLLVLMILAIVVVGTVRLTNRDTSQVASNLKYQNFFNVSETKAQDVIQNIADISATDMDQNTGTNSFITDNPNCLQTERLNNLVGYECSFSDPNNEGNNEILNTVTINQTKYLEDYPVNKDETFAIQLDGYKDSITLSWNEIDAALELKIVYFTDSNGNKLWDENEFLDSTTGTYDITANGVFKKDANANAVSNAISTRSAAAIDGNAINFLADIGQSSGVSSSANTYPLYMNITPRIPQNSLFKSIKLTMQADDYSIFPYQVREVVSKTYDTADGSTPFVELKSVVPIRPQMDSIFNYSLITPDDVVLPTN